MKLWLDADELEYMMEGKQLGAVEGGKRLQVLWELRREIGRAHV